jgi:hypothetical protein
MSRKNVYAILSFFIGISIFYLAFREHSDPESVSMISTDCGGGIVLITGYLFGRHRGSNVLFKAIMLFPIFAATYNYSASHYIASLILAPIEAILGFIVFSCALMLVLRYNVELLPNFLIKYRNILD